MHVAVRVCHVYDPVTQVQGILYAGLAQSVERQALNLVVVGSSPTFGEHF